jgi:Periplasmic component of the Tol biopolymer transport system
VFSSLRDSAYGRNGARNLEVLKTKEDGSDIANLSRNAAADTDPAWSPGGKHVAFASDRNGNFDIFVMSDEGTELRQLTYDTMDERHPRWSPDGRRIAFESGRDGLVPAPGYLRFTDLFVADADGSRIRNLTGTPTTYESWAAWSPDGNTIAYSRRDSSGTQVFLVNADGTNPRPLRPRDKDYVDEAPAWSPDGSKLAISAFEVNHPFATDTYAILTVNVDGSDAHLITRFARFPSWSPDGSRIVFTRDAVDEWWGRFSTQNVWIMNSDGSNQAQLTQDKWMRNQTESPQAWTK